MSEDLSSQVPPQEGNDPPQDVAETAEETSERSPEVPPHEDSGDTLPEAPGGAGWVSPTFKDVVEAEEAEPPEVPFDGSEPPEGVKTECPVCGHQWDGFAPLANDPNTEPCPDCKGFGETITGSLVPDQVTRRCVRCNGNGFIDHVESPQITLPTFTPVEVAETPQAEEVSYDWRYRA